MTKILGMVSFFDDWLGGLGWCRAEKNYLFRGVPSKNYDPGEPSAYRRLLKDEFGDDTSNRKTLSNLLKINRDLIDEARFRGFNRYDRLSDLEILGDLQHFGAATCLIDFTFHPGIALWFACQPTSEEGEDGKYGKVVAVRNDESIKEVRPEWLLQNKKIEDFFKADESGEYPIYRWQPENITNRAERQQGVFLFGGGQIEFEDECYIHDAQKIFFLGGISGIGGIGGMYNIREEVLFPDFNGFIHRNAQGIPYNPDPKSIGINAQRRGHYDKAIDCFTEALYHKPDSTDLYYRRGCARIEMKLYEEALEDFRKVLKLKSNSYYQSLVYWQRGRVKAKLGQHKEAKEYYQMGLQFAQDTNFAHSISSQIKEDLAELEP